jgi:hypothetical protein
MGKYMSFKSVEIKSYEIYPMRKRTKRGTRNLHPLSNGIFQKRRTKGGFIHGKQNDEEKEKGYILPFQTITHLAFRQLQNVILYLF